MESSTVADVTSPGLGGRGGGRMETPLRLAGCCCSAAAVLVRVGRGGLDSPVTCGDIGTLQVPFASCSLPGRLPTMEWWTGGGSKSSWKVLARGAISICCERGRGRGRVGRDGGVSSSALSELLGGLLKGERRSMARGVASRAGLLSTDKAYWAGIFGFSARFTGGGAGLVSRSLLNSPDRRGGGGDGGCDGVSRGDLRRSNVGVSGRLGILKWRGDAAGDTGFTMASAFRKAGWSPVAIFSSLPLGGDWGGSTRTEGGAMGRGLSGGGGPRRFEGRGLLEEAMLVSFGLVLTGTAGGSLETAASCGFSSFGAGEAVRGASVGASEGLLMFSNRARREETGFCFIVRYEEIEEPEGLVPTMEEPSSPSLLSGMPMMLTAAMKERG